MGLIYTKPRELHADDDLVGFECGAEFVDSWLRDHALAAAKQKTAVIYATFVGRRLAGFYCLSAHSIARGSIGGGWLRRNVPQDVPVVLMGMLGVDKRDRGKGLGAQLLRDAILRAESVSKIAGAHAFVVDPLDEQAASFYARFGFKAVPGSVRMYIPL